MAPVDETFGFSILVKSQLDYEHGAGPAGDSQTRERADMFAKQLEMLFATRTGARVSAVVVRATGAVIDHVVEFDFRRFEDWRRWHRFFWGFAEEVESWIEHEWRVAEGEALTLPLVSVVPSSDPEDETTPASPKRSRPVMTMHQRRMIAVMGIAIAVSAFAGAAAASAWWAYNDLRTELMELKHRDAAAAAGDPRAPVVVAYPPQQQPPQNADRRRDCPDCPVILRVEPH